MIILDHNIPQSQAEELRKSRIRYKQIGIHVGRPEWDDQQEILRYLHRHHGSTFFTRDLGFYLAHLRHRSRYRRRRLRNGKNDYPFSQTSSLSNQST